MTGNEFEGKLIGVTRPAERVNGAVSIIEAHGGRAFVAPTLELKVSNTKSLIKLCKMAGELDWLIFTSPTAIISIFKHCQDINDRLNPNCKIVVIGPRTENFLNKKGLKADMIPNDYTAEGLLDIFSGLKLRDQNIGLPITMAAGDVLPDGLKKMGADVIIAEAYRSELPENKDKVEHLITSIINRKVDAVTFTSSLTVRNLFKMVNGKEKEDMLKVLRNGEVVVAAIGPVTAKPLEKEDIPVLIPKEYTVKSMLEILMNKI